MLMSVPTHTKALDLAYIALMAALIALCAWISVPLGPVPFTMQTFGIFAALGLLGGRRGTLAFLIYLLLGIVGLPVFSGFSAGAGVLFGATGGYLLGYLAAALLFWGLTAKLGQTLPVMAWGWCSAMPSAPTGFSPSTPAAAGRPCWAP